MDFKDFFSRKAVGALSFIKQEIRQYNLRGMHSNADNLGGKKQKHNEG
jgi:hypothetical protein